MVNVYGVAVEGTEGRIGMAALLSEDPATFDGKAFYRFVSDALPRYAAPYFVRLVGAAEITGTLKLRKVELREEGFDIERIADPVLFRNDETYAYVPLTRERLAEIKLGTRKL